LFLLLVLRLAVPLERCLCQLAPRTTALAVSFTSAQAPPLLAPASAVPLSFRVVPARLLRVLLL
jgi:hypothetical protein